ncbi:MAG: DUF1631 domain-containing protein [Pseudomonadales bacterium]|nr:DUF1631 domain-containing protein [Pseudomonadales bacterium]
MFKGSKSGSIKAVKVMSRPEVGVLSSPVEKVRIISTKGLLNLLGDMFDQADDTLFQMADRAENNIEQNHYFESMREIRVKRRGVESCFVQQIDRCFKTLPTLTETTQGKTGFEAISVDTLSIVKNDELEESVAIDAMVAKARNNNISELSTLSLRIDALLPYVQFTLENNPIDPKQICSAFAEASKMFELEIKAKLILFKLFDKKVLANIGQVIQASNQSLVDDNILPSLTYEKVQEKKRLDSAIQKEHPAANKSSVTMVSQNQIENERFIEENAASEDIPTLIQVAPPDGIEQVTRNLRPISNCSGKGGGAISPLISSVDMGARQTHVQKILPQSQLLSILNELQNSSLQIALDQFSDSSIGEASSSSLDIRSAIHDILHSKQQSKSQSMISQGNNFQANNDFQDNKVAVGKNDNDIINLVAMLFEFILDDRNMPEAVKSRISRLQIPVLKVAIMDHSFINHATHPLRRLLNQLAQAGVGLGGKEDYAQDKLHNKLDEVITRILTEFETGAELFDELLEDFNDFIESEERRTRIIEQRTKDSEEGKARAEQARDETARILHDKIKGANIPSELAKMLSGPWSNYLFLLFLKYGKNNDQWKEGVQTVDDLIWSIQPKENRTDREKLLLTIPGLLRDLKQGLEMVSYSPLEMSILFDELKRIHQVCARSSTSRKVKTVRAKKVSENEFVANLDANSSAGKLNLSTSQSVTHVDNINGSIRSHEDAEALCKEISDLDSENNGKQVTSGHSDAFLEHANSLQVGAWVEFITEDHSSVRCKLAAKIKAVDKLIFVNRAGVKVLEKTTSELSAELEQGVVKFLDDAMLFDRALESVIGTLRKSETTRQFV